MFGYVGLRCWRNPPLVRRELQRLQGGESDGSRFLGADFGLDFIMLVGHGYAGMVISAVAERARPRLRSLVYLDAFVPQDGKRMIDYIPQADCRAAR